VGANCGAGPEHFVKVAARLAEATELPVWIKPNAGLPELREGKTVFPMGPEAFAGHVPALLAAGANFLGGCCGTTPDHIRALRARVS
jgi:5-methyltetrahydrofolate--homocysteine methyltransferase